MGKHNTSTTIQKKKIIEFYFKIPILIYNYNLNIFIFLVAYSLIL